MCKLPSDRHDVCDAPQKLRNHPGFIALSEDHLRLHRTAKLLLITADAGNPIATLDYDNFANTLERLRLEIFALERELENSLFNHDSLTGAITRYGILPTLREQQELVKRHAQRCYIAMMDLDNFKAINDLHGYAAGDKVLSASVRYLIQHLRPYEKVFRYGGEEFLLCMPYTDLTPGFDRVEELKNGIATLDIDIGAEQPIRVEASLGMALLDPEVPVEQSIDRADKALYAAKVAGRNCVKVWDASM